MLQLDIGWDRNVYCTRPARIVESLAGRRHRLGLTDLQIGAAYMWIAGLAKANLEGFAMCAGRPTDGGFVIRFSQRKRPWTNLTLQGIVAKYRLRALLRQINHEGGRDGQKGAGKNQAACGKS